VQLTERQVNFSFALILFSGLFFCLVVPPFQTPDEFNHNYKIHHLAQGYFYPEIDTPSLSLGGKVPKSLVNTSKFYGSLVFSENKAPLDTLKLLLKIPLKRSEKEFIFFPNTARYAFTSYLATIPVAYVGDSFGINPLYTMYAGRIINFLFWFFCILFGFRIMPIFKELYLFICMIPGTISIHASLSADTVNNGLLFLIIALFFDFKFSKRSISNLKLGIYSLLTLIVAWNKIIYFPLLFLLFYVPKEHFGSSLHRLKYITLLFVSVMGVVLFWNQTIDKYIYPFDEVSKNTYHNLHEYEDGRIGYEQVNPRLQTERIKQSPMAFLETFLPAVFELCSYNNKSYVSNVGWESKPMNPILNIIFIVFFLIYILSLPNVFRRNERLFLGVLAYIIAALFLLSQHLHWDPVGEKIHKAHIGKYFIAIYPLLFFAVSGLFNTRIKMQAKQFNIPIWLVVVMVIAHLDMYLLTLERFYWGKIF
jgi:uncharacterized membrane protein